MRTPAGIECPYFYGDYYRGRTLEECRLIGDQPPPQNWTPDLCFACPVPSIKRANACEFMELTPSIRRKFGIFKRHVEIEAFCTKANHIVKEPLVGCPEFHSLEIKIGKV